MPQTEPVTILIVNEHAEEVKLVTIGLRGFFPDCLIEVAYSAEEATAMASRTGQAWVVVLIDDDALPEASATFINDLKRRAPYAAIIIQSTRTNSRSAVEALQSGANYFLSKQSPAFLTELLFCAKEALEKHALRLATDLAEARHRRLLELLDFVVYELDAEGRFTSANQPLFSWLGYRPEELVGLPYHTILPEDQRTIAHFKFNERRSGMRAVTGLALGFRPKPQEIGTTIPMTGEVSARGLYASSGRFLGSIGIIRDLSRQKREEATIHAIQEQAERTEQLRTLADQIASLSRELQEPLTTLLTESQHLLAALHEIRPTDRVEAMTERATAAKQLGERLERLIRDSSRMVGPYTLNHLLEDLLTSAFPEPKDRHAVKTDFAASLPSYQGDREGTIRLFQRLLTYARGYLVAVGRTRTLIVKTTGTGLLSPMDAPTLFPLAPKSEVTVELSESDLEPPSEPTTPSALETVDLADLYRLSRQLGATLDLSAPARGPLRILVRFAMQPDVLPQPSGKPVHVEPPSTEIPTQIEILTQPPPPFIAAERRTARRVITSLPAHITIGSSTWDGTLLNISTGGACVGLPSEFPSIARHDAYIVVRTAAGILELTGVAHGRTVSAVDEQASLPHTRLVIVFHPAPPVEGAVLTSLIEAARERSLSFTFELLLAAEQKFPLDFAEHDRRESVRVPLTLPVRLETPIFRDPTSRLRAQTVNVSRDGASLLARDPPETGQGSIIIHFAPPHLSNQLGSHEPGAPATALPARIVWSAPETTTYGTFQGLDAPRLTRIGVRFHSLTPYAGHELNRVIKQHLMAQRTSDALSTSAPVISVPRECRNARGQTIAIIDNHLRDPAGANTPVVIVAPGFGQTALDYAALSYYLAEHQFRVLRYDHTNHLGNSEGELQHTTLRSMQHDLSTVVDFVRHTWPQAPVLLLASDLAARAALKAATQIRPVDLLLLVNPSIDIGAMLMTVHGHDLIADYHYGLRRGIANLLGLNVNVDLFVGDLIAGHFTDLQSTLADLRLTGATIGIVSGPTTTFSSIPPADLPHAFMSTLGPRTRVISIPTPLTDHTLLVRESHPAAFKQILEQISSALPAQDARPPRDSSARQHLARQRKIEQEYTCLLHDGAQIGREALCSAHLAQLPQLANLQEYRTLLDDLYRFMSPLDAGSVSVDAGIGESDLIRASLVNHLYRTGHATWISKSSPLLVGARRTSETIGPARHAVQILQRELASGFVGRLGAMPPLMVAWIQADWTESLPFRTDTLHRLVCNLALPYVPSPLSALREWLRILRPEGRLILTTFHPDTDLSSLYRHTLRQTNQDEFSAQAQPLLHFFGRIREAIHYRTLHTFDQGTLSDLLRQCGLSSFQILPVFEGQALVAIVEKRISTSSLQ